MTVLQAGQAVPNRAGVFVQVVPPQTNFLSPAETDILGIVGIASWGPVNTPTPVAGQADGTTKFGAVAARKYDLMTAVTIAGQQGAQNMLGVRVTDGTDTSAAAALGLQGVATLGAGGTGNVVNDVLTLTNGATIKVNTVSSGAVATFTQLTQPTSQVSGSVAVVSTTGTGSGATFTYTYSVGASVASKYTGSGANGDTVSIAAGSQAGTWKVTTFHSGIPGETYDNIGSGLTGTALWAAIVAAVNNGNAVRGPSQIAVLTAGTSSATPTAQTVSLTGGTDGATTITASVLLGSDAAPRTGMYSLRKSNASVAMLADCDTSSSWPTQVAFGLSEGVYMVGTGPAGDTISNAVSTKASAGVDSYAFKLLFGDWVYWFDLTNNLPARLVSPQAFIAGWIAADQPQFGTLNKPLNGVIGTQRSVTNIPYYDDELSLLRNAGIDVIGQSSFAPSYYAALTGHNSSSSPLVRGDNYTRMTNFIAATLSTGMAPFIGQLQSPTSTDVTRPRAKATLDSYFLDMVEASPPAIADWLVVLDLTNNTLSQIALGKIRADVKVQYLSVIEQFLVNVEGGQSVQITRVATTSTV